MQPQCFHVTKTFFITFFMSLCPSHKSLPRWSYVITLVSLLPPELLSLVTFSAAVIRLPFDWYQIIWVYCGCLCWGECCTPLIIAETSRLCEGLALFVATEAVVLVVFFFLLRHSFTACSLAGSFSIICWILQLSRDHSSFPYHMVGSLMSTPFSLWFLFPLPNPPWPPRIPLTRPPLPSNLPHLPPLLPLPDELTCRLHP